MSDVVDEAEALDAKLTRWFWLFLTAHMVLWTVVPSMTAPNLSLDALEMVTWGREWQLGYYKHPPLPAWIARAFTNVTGHTTWPLYALSAAVSGMCLWAAFTLGRRIAGPFVGFAGAVSLEACHYFTFTSVEFNNNIVSRAFAAVAVVFVHRGMTSKRTLDWAVAGAMLGLGLLAKYDVAVLAIVLLGYSLLRAEPRKNWRTPGPYAMLASAVAVFGPHLLWAWQHDFPTLEYAARRSVPAESWIDHVISPLRFGASQLLAILPIVAVVGWALAGRSHSEQQQEVASSTTREDRAFLFAVVGAVFLIIVTAALLTGGKVRSMWGSSLWTFAGVAVVLFAQQRRPQFDPAAAARRLAGCSAAVGVALLLAIGVRHAFGPELRGKPSRIHFPGSAVAAEIEQAWDDVSSDPLPAVAGTYWLAGNVSYSGHDDAAMYIDGSPESSPWTDDETFAREGGVIVWTGEEPAELLARFPSREESQVRLVEYERRADTPPAEVSFCVVPPAAMTAAADDDSVTR